ncbi:GTP-binding protein [Ferruginibacter paludis]|uniref:GTP-binding protein n=1 Tax=Ferruginibacter paludis TaxID=1310417 RepID=UPI0025B3C504|nr:GTP-binding protein [Ferruginibacter paludis]MDN3655476.1 GTP-binding protein [Ferruginibacter paludis]
MKIHLLSGFLGGGKTTAMQAAAKALLQHDIHTGVITNDQGIKLVDGDSFKSTGIPGRQVTGGCFCCNFAALDSSIQSLVTANNTAVIFAESVGSCTDIVATVVKPLLQFYPAAQVTISAFADVRLLQLMLNGGTNLFDETVNYIYLKQLEEAGIIVVNKTDLTDQTTLAEIKVLMQQKYPAKIILYQNSLDENDIRQWIGTVNNDHSSGSLASLDISYDTYAAGEAKLGWLDQELEIHSSDNNALQQAEDLVNLINKKITGQQYAIGHLKFLINATDKISFTNDKDPTVKLKKTPSTLATLLINARVQTDAENILQQVSAAIKEIEKIYGCKIVVCSQSAFQPGYPKPLYRL